MAHTVSTTYNIFCRTQRPMESKEKVVPQGRDLILYQIIKSHRESWLLARCRPAVSAAFAASP